MKSRNVKNLRMMRALLSAPDGRLTKYRVAKLAECSIPWVIEFLRKLERQKLAKGTRVLDADRLMDLYTGIMPKTRHFDFFVQEPLKFLKQSKLDYALTTYAAENLVSRHLFPSRYDAYVKASDLDKWKAMILEKGLIGKGNLRLLVANDEFVLKEAKEVKGINIVSMPQLLIDLKAEGGVCMEAYNILVKRDV